MYKPKSYLELLEGNNGIVNCKRCNRVLAVKEPGAEVESTKFERIELEGCPNCHEPINNKFAVAWHNDTDGDDMMLARTVQEIPSLREATELGERGLQWFEHHDGYAIDEFLQCMVVGPVINTMQPTGFWVHGPHGSCWFSLRSLSDRSGELTKLVLKLRERGDTDSLQAAAMIENLDRLNSKLIIESILMDEYASFADAVREHFVNEDEQMMKTAWRERLIRGALKRLLSRCKSNRERTDIVDDQKVEPAPTMPLEKWEMMLQGTLRDIDSAKDHALHMVQMALADFAAAEGITKMEFLYATHYYRGAEEVTSAKLDAIESLYCENVHSSGFQGIWTITNGWDNG